MSATGKDTQFRLLLLGQGVSALGDWMVTVALMAVVLQLSGSSTAVAGVLVLRLLPASVGGPLAARAAERWDRRKTMLAMDAVRAGIVIMLPFVRALWWVYLWAVALETASLVFLPARDASIPDLVSEMDLPTANGLVLGSSYGTIPLGAGAFAAIAALSPGHGFLASHPFSLVFWFDSLTFMVSFAIIRRMYGLGRRQPSAGPQSSEHGFRKAFRIPLVRLVQLPTASVALGLGCLFSCGIVYVKDILRASNTDFGVLIALFGAGAAFGLVALRALRGVDSLVIARMGVLTQGATIALMSLANTLPLAFLGAAAFGGATALTLSSGMSALQERLTGQDRVLAFAAFHIVIRAGLSISALAAGAATDLLFTVHLPLVGTLQPARLILICAGALVFLTGFLIAPPPQTANESTLFAS
jgi:predicted MFS family arabinose efflux permease